MVLVIVIASIVCLLMIRSGQIDRNPWVYIATATAILAAVTGMAITIGEAKADTEVEEREDGPDGR